MAQKPVKTFNDKSIEATIWSNLGTDNEMFHTVVIARNYKDSNDQWRKSNYYLLEHLESVELVTSSAKEYLAKLQKPEARAEGKEQASGDDPRQQGHAVEQLQSEQKDEPVAADVAAESNGFVQRMAAGKSGRSR